MGGHELKRLFKENPELDIIAFLDAMNESERQIEVCLKENDPFQKDHCRWGRHYREYNVPLSQVGWRIERTQVEKGMAMFKSYSDSAMCD